jgi:hypothetical protein
MSTVMIHLSFSSGDSKLVRAPGAYLREESIVVEGRTFMRTQRFDSSGYPVFIEFA